MTASADEYAEKTHQMTGIATFKSLRRSAKEKSWTEGSWWAARCKDAAVEESTAEPKYPPVTVNSYLWPLKLTWTTSN